MKRHDVLSVVGKAMLSLLEVGWNRGVQCDKRRVGDLSTGLLDFLTRSTTGG